MIDGLERALRDEFALRATQLPGGADIADLVIVRAKKIRRRRHVMAAGAACLTLVLAGATAVWASGLVTIGVEQPPGSNGEVQTREDGLSTLVDQGQGVDIGTSDGEVINTGLEQIFTASEVTGGWLVSGTTGGVKEQVRYVNISGDLQDLGDGVVFPNERGDAAVVESYTEDNGTSTGTIYQFGSDGRVDPVDSQEVPEGYRIDGMAGDTVWLRLNDDTETTLGSWQIGSALETVPTETSVEPLAPVADGQVLADVSEEPRTFCPAVVDPAAKYAVTARGNCYEQQAVFSNGVSVSPDGMRALVYMQPADSDGSGEWNWLDLTMETDLEPTGKTIDIRPVINRDGDAIFAEPGNQYLSLDTPDLIPQPSAR